MARTDRALLWIVCTLACSALASAGTSTRVRTDFFSKTAQLSLTLLNDTRSVEIGARCLDGSPSGYYLARSNSTRWVFFLEGGGLCYTPWDCKARAKTHLGSSDNWRPSRTPSAVQSTDPTVNPLFHDANMVFIPYCSGDLHSGQRKVAHKEITFGLYFSGHLTILAVVDSLRRTGGLNDATEILLTGESAGGIGTISHASYIADEFPTAAVKAAPNAGWFISVKPFKFGRPALSVSLGGAHVLYAGYHSKECRKIHKFTPWLCYLGQYAYTSLTTPLFIIEHQFDSHQIVEENGLNKDDPKAPQYISKFGGQMRKSVMEAGQYRSNRTGYFLMSCFQHLVRWAGKATIDDLTPLQALGKWYNGEQSLQVADPMCTDGQPCRKSC